MDKLPELLLIDKPAGITSMDVIRELRKQYRDRRGVFLDETQGTRKTEERGVLTDTVTDEATAVTQRVAKKPPRMGHAGTLDPLATGLMLVGVGPGTKKLADLVKLDKEYIAEVRIGESRLTGDLEGEVLEKKSAKKVTEEDVLTELDAMIGNLKLAVSAYSAIKVGGVPMYKRARKAEVTGETIKEVPMREMEVKGAQLLKFESGDRAVATVRFHVGSGTYIRSLGEELGRRLGYPATLQNLRRTKVGEFDIKDAETL